MNKSSANRLKLGIAVVCIALAVGTLPSIYLIGSGLLSDAVSLADRAHFQTKLAIYSGQVVVLALAAIVLLRHRRHN